MLRQYSSNIQLNSNLNKQQTANLCQNVQEDMTHLDAALHLINQSVCVYFWLKYLSFVALYYYSTFQRCNSFQKNFLKCLLVIAGKTSESSHKFKTKLCLSIHLISQHTILPLTFMPLRWWGASMILCPFSFSLVSRTVPVFSLKYI